MGTKVQACSLSQHSSRDPKEFRVCDQGCARGYSTPSAESPPLRHCPVCGQHKPELDHNSECSAQPPQQAHSSRLSFPALRLHHLALRSICSHGVPKSPPVSLVLCSSNLSFLPDILAPSKHQESPGGSDSRESSGSAEDLGQFLGQEDPLEEEMPKTHSSTLTWRIPWTE